MRGGKISPNGIRHVPIVAHFLALTAFFFQSAPHSKAQAPEASAFKPIVVQMSYYAEPGMEAEVLQWRLHACEVLEKLGTRHGRVMRYVPGPRSAGAGDHPDVIWQSEFPDRESFDRYEKIAASDPEFGTVREHMSNLTPKTERAYWEPE
jgi:hypothetical protein